MISCRRCQRKAAAKCNESARGAGAPRGVARPQLAADSVAGFLAVSLRRGCQVAKRLDLAQLSQFTKHALELDPTRISL